MYGCAYNTYITKSDITDLPQNYDYATGTSQNKAGRMYQY